MTVTTRDQFPIGYLDRAAEKFPNAIALEQADTTFTYADLKKAVDALAAAFQARVGTRALIGICTFNCLEYVVATLAIQASGNIQVVLNPRNSKGQLKATVETVSPALIVIAEDCLDLVDSGDRVRLIARFDTRPLDNIESIGALIAEFDRQMPVWPDMTLDDVNGVKFTGGSTGAPKAVLQAYRNIICMIESYQDYYDFGPDECHLGVAPLTHAAGTFIFAVFKAGGKLIVLPAPDVDIILDAFEHKKVTSSFLPPTLFYNMMQVPGVETRKFPCLRQLIYGAAPMTPESILKVQAIFGPVIGVSYGQTEAPMVIAAGSAEDLAARENLSSVGRVNARLEVAVVDPEGHKLPAGSMGEVIVKGDLVMNGYLDPAQTATTVRDGWLHTGDVGIIDERGYLFLKDRIKDIIISGGFNIYPSEVESAFSRHDDIHEAIVFGCPDEKWGERVEAAIVLKAGAKTGAKDLIAFVKGQVGSVQAPKVVHIVESLPRNAVGKVTRLAVREYCRERA